MTWREQNLPADHPYAKWSWSHAETQGFGRQVLGETWQTHHGNHGSESTRGILAPGQKQHPILTGLKDGDVWGPTDVYGVRLPLPGDSQPLVLGQVVAGMKFDDPPVAGEKNEPMMPVAWTKTYKGSAGKAAKVFATTMGAATDLENAGVRRLLVNAVYWTLGLEKQITANSSVDLVGKFEPSPFKFGGYKRGVKPSEHAGF